MSRFDQARNITKADVRIEERDGKKVVVKDYSGRSRLVRFFYGRFTLRREFQVYRLLEGVSGIPRCYGYDGAYTLLLEYIQSRPLSSFKPGQVGEAVFDKAAGLLSRIHERGVAIVDLHRSNILITETEDVYMIDFAHAVLPGRSGRAGPCGRFFMKLDRHALARNRARYLKLPKPVPEGVFGLTYKAGRLCKSFMRLCKPK